MSATAFDRVAVGMPTGFIWDSCLIAAKRKRQSATLWVVLIRCADSQQTSAPVAMGAAVTHRPCRDQSVAEISMLASQVSISIFRIPQGSPARCVQRC